MPEVINRFVPEVHYDTIAGQRVKMELDIISSGERRKTFYDKSTKYVKLHDEVFVLQNVIGKIAKTASKGRVKSINEKSALANKIKIPNNDQSQQEWLKEFVIFIKSAGFVCVWKKWESVGNFETMQLINLNPDETDFLDNGNIVSVWKGESYEIAKGDYIPFYDTVRGKNGKGKAVAYPLRSQIDNCLDAQIAKGIQIEKSGVTIVSNKASANRNDHDGGLDQTVMPPIAMPSMVAGEKPKVLKTQGQLLEEKFSGRGVSNRVIVSNVGVDAISLSDGLQEMRYSEIVEPDILAICDAFGVPVELTPYGKNATYDNKAIAELSLTENEVIPLADSLIESLVLEFPTKGDAFFDYSHLNCMSIVEKRVQETNGVAIDHLVKLSDKGWINDNTAKRVLKKRNIIEDGE